MLKIFIFSAFIVQFVLFWSWLLYSPTDMTGPPERI